MTYLNMARAYRPKIFADVVAQTHITETLQRALETERVASAYLFTGPRGSGKTTVARLLAKAVNCKSPKKGEPCTRCESCEAITKGRDMDVLEIDGASNNSVDDIRELRENVRYAASAPGQRKVYIIDEVHMLSLGAFNALLKTLEEPPAHVLFIFATTEAHKVPQTILSRCQRFDFRRLTVREIHERLKYVCRKEKELDIAAEALFVLAKRADGSMRDALSLLDQVRSSTKGRIEEPQVAEVLGLVREEVYLDLTEAISQQDPVRCVQQLHETLQEGADPAGFVLGLLEHFRNLLMLSVGDALQETVLLSDAHLKRAQDVASQFQTEDLLHLLNRIAAIHEEVRRSSNAVVILEAAMVELAHFESRVLLREVLDQLGGEGEDGGPPRASGARRGATSATARSGGSSRRSTSSASAVPGLDRPSASLAADSTTMRRDDIVAGGPPTLPGAPSLSPARPAAARVSLSRFGEAQIVSPQATTVVESQTTQEAVEATSPVAVQDFDSHLDAAFAEPQATEPTPQPAPQTARPAVPSFTGATLDFAALCEHWQDFADVVRSSKAMLAHCLSEGQPQSLQGGTLGLLFGEDQAFHLNLLREPATQRELEKQIEKYFGQHLKVTLNDIATPAQSAQPAQPAPERASARLTPEDVAESRREAAQDVLQSTPLLQEILDTFDGEILEDNQT